MSDFTYTVGGDFSELLRGFQQLEARAQQTGDRVGQGINGGIRSSTQTLANLQAELDRLQRVQSRVTITGAGFDVVGRQIRAVEQQIEALSRRRVTLNADPGSIVALQARLGELNGELGRVAIGGQRFKDLQREIRGVEQALGRAAGAARSFRPNLGTTQGLQAELARLQRIQGRVSISSPGLELVQQRIEAVQGQIDTLNRRRVLLNADPGSIIALQARLSELNQRLGQVAIGSQAFRRLQTEIQGVERDLRNAGEAGGLAARGVGVFQNVLGALGVATGAAAVVGFFRSSIQQAIALESITRRLSNTLGEQGAGKALGFARQLSDQLGISYRVLADSFGRFTAAATAANVPIEQQRELFAAVSRAGQSLGLTNDELNGSFLALQQIASKGTVAMEELRGQLGERLPIALAATARGFGISQKELIKLVETGQVTASQFFPAFTKGLNELTAASGGVPTAAQNLQKFQNAWDELQVSFGTNLLPGAISVVKQLTAALEELRVQQRGRDLGFAAGVGGISTGAAQVAGEVDRLAKKYSLTAEQAGKFAEAVKNSAPKVPLFGAMREDGAAIQQILSGLEPLAKRYAGTQRDATGETLKQAAAEKSLADSLEGKAKELQKATATSIQQAQIRLLEAEAAAVQRVTAGKLSQADADKQLRAAQLKALGNEIRGYDDLIRKLEAAKAAGGGVDKDLTAARSARAQKALEAAKLEAEAAKAEVAQRQKALDLAITRLQIAQQSIDLEERAGQVAAARLRTQQQVLDAQLALQQAQQGLTDSLFGVDRARQQFAITAAEAELQRLRDRNAGVGAIRQQEQRIASLKQGAETIERRALEATIAGAAQRFDLERRVLQLKQAQQVIEAQAAQRAAAQNTVAQQQKLIELQKQLVDPSLAGPQRAAVEQQVSLQREAIGLARQQQQAEAGRLAILGTVFGLEQQTLRAQQATTANGLRAQAATRGWEQALAGPLSNLDAAAQSAGAVATGIQQISAGFISAAGQTVQILTAVQEIGGAAAAAASSASALASGYATANDQAQALLGTLQRIATTPQARWSGGPVDPSTAYRINELGQESLLGPGGALSLINAPARSLWRPPTRGTVLPAGVTAALKTAGAFGRPMTAAAGPRLGNLEAEIAALRVEIRGLRQKDWNLSVHTPGNAGLLRAIGGL